MAKAKKLPSGSWRVQIFVGKNEDGKRKYKSFTAPTKKEAEFLASEYAISKKESASPSKMTLGEAMDNFIGSKDAILSPSTVREYKLMRNRIPVSFAEKQLSKITRDELQYFVNEEAKRVKWKTVYNTYYFIVAVLKKYRPDFSPIVALPPKQIQEMYVPTDEDIQRLTLAIKGTSLEIPVYLAAFASLRRSEICALDNVDEKNRTITVKNALVTNDKKALVKKPPKTMKSHRTIEIPQFLVDMLAEKKKAGVPFVEIKPSTITTRFNIILKREGLPHFRFHDLRHYNASIMHALGVPDKYAMARGGWRTPTTLHKVYQHIMDEKAKEVNDTVNTHFSELMQHKMQHEK